MQVQVLSPAPRTIRIGENMGLLKLFLTLVLALSFVSPALAKEGEDGTGKIVKAAKITRAEETVDIRVAGDIVDPDRPKKEYKNGEFGISIYSDKSLGWHGLINIVPVDTGLKGDKIRLTAGEAGVNVALEKLRYWPGVDWYQPTETVAEFTSETDKTYEFSVPLNEQNAAYRLCATKGEKISLIYLSSKIFSRGVEYEFTSTDFVDYKLEKYEPMSHLARVYAYWTAHKGEDVRYIRTLYWRTIATGWSMVMSKVSPLDEDGYYHSTEWFFDEFAYALFPGVDWPDLRREDHVLWFAERSEPYVIRRRTFDINQVNIIRQRREGDYLVVTMRVEGDKKDKDVDIYMTAANRYKHPFPWKIEKGVIL